MAKKKVAAKAKKATPKKMVAKKATPVKKVVIPDIEPRKVVVKEEKVDIEALRKEEALKVSQAKAKIRIAANKPRIVRPH